MSERPSLAEAPQFPVTVGLGLAAIALFGLEMAGYDVRALYFSGATFWEAPWQLLTSTLAHGSFFHMAFNVYWLWIFGAQLERELGSLSFGGLVLLFGAGSMGAEYALLDGGIGLSGIGYGLFGLLYGLSRWDTRFRDAMDDRTRNLFVGWFFVCIILTVTDVYPVANIAHGIGALLGFVTALALTKNQSTPIRAGAALGLVSLVVAAILGASIGRPLVNLSETSDSGPGRIAEAAFEAGDFDRALHYYQRARALNPQKASNWYNIGVVEQRLNHPVRMQAAFDRAHELAPDAPRYNLH